jgi:hypothetical protein
MPATVLVLGSLFANAGVADAAREPPLLVAVDKCPAKAACVVVDVNVPAKEKDLSRVVRATGSACGGKIFRIHGRLRGSAVRPYHLTLQGACKGQCGDGRAAYYGRSARDAPVIATNLGRFEIVDQGVAVGAGGDLIVIDEATQTAAHYLGNHAASADFFVERKRVFMRHGGNGACVTAPQEKPGFLRDAGPQRCRLRASGDGAPIAFADLAPQSQAYLKRFFAPNAAQRSTEEVLRHRIRRVNGLIVVQANDRCTDPGAQSPP